MSVNLRRCWFEFLNKVFLRLKIVCASRKSIPTQADLLQCVLLKKSFAPHEEK